MVGARGINMRNFGIITKCFLATLVVALLIGCGQETVTIPSVVSTTPANGATSVAITTSIGATFSMAMNSGSLTGSTFTVTGPGGAVAGSVTYSGTTATFTPASALAYSTAYTATISVGAANLGGTHLLNNYSWTFTTITPPPAVISTNPANLAVNVPIGQVLSATFSEAMNCATLTSPATTFTVIGPGGTPVAGTVACAGAVATFTPTASLAYSTVYTATISTGAQDVASQPLVATYVWSFTTITPPPQVIATIPVNGATGVPISQVLAATFSEAMNCATIASPATTFTLTGPGGTPVAGTVSCAGAVATFTPTASLAYSTLYTATISTGAQDIAGQPLAATYAWTFTTITPLPQVIATIPVNGATGVPISQLLTATFNEAMNCATIASPATTFILTGPGSTPVAGTVACAGAVATFTPAASLAVNTVYTATITTGAQDLAGQALATNYVWTFRTVPAPTPPVVISTVPANGATGVPTNQAVTATFSEAMNPLTINGTTFTLTGPGATPVTGVVTYVAAGSIATFTPAAPLAPSTVYTATINTGAMDLANVPMAQNYVWTFTTAAAPIIIPPMVIATIPLNGATSVPLNQLVSATFNKPMNPATLNGTTFKLTGPGLTPVAGLVAYAAIGDTLTFTPASNLAPNTLFTATITTGAQDLAGDALASNYVWTFTTGPTVTVIAPEIVSTVPANQQDGVKLNQAVSATFTEAMNPLSITTATFQLTGPGGVAVSGIVSYDAVNFIATFTPMALLAPNSSYTATLTSGVTDLTGNPLGNTGAPNPWMFTTGTTLIAPPIVLGPTISVFGGLGGGAGMTNQGLHTVINGSIATTGASTKITGFHDDSVMVAGLPQCVYTETGSNVGLVTGAIDTGTPPPTVGCPNEGTAVTFSLATQAALEAQIAYNTLQNLPPGITLPTDELGNLTLAPGTYTSASFYDITAGPLTLDAQGDPNATWVFQMGSYLTVGTPTAPESVILINGAKASNVYWQVGGLPGAVINDGGGGTMVGTIISSPGITISSPGVAAVTTINGRVLALNASVTMVNTVINLP